MTPPIYETIVERSNDGIFVVQDGTIVYANERLRELTGYDAGDLRDVPKTSIIAPADRSTVEAYHAARLAGDPAPDTYEVELATTNGGRVPVEVSVNVGDYEGRTAVYAICRDISERKRRETELQALTRKYESVFEASEDPLFLLSVDDEGTVRYRRFNDREEAVTGKSTDEVRGKTPVEVFGDELGAELAANYRECLEQDEPITYEETLQLQGERTYWQTKLTPIRTDGEITHIIGTGRDVTELKRKQQALERSRQRLQVLFDKTPDSIVIHDPSGDIVDVNEQTTDSLGYTQAELTRMNVDDIEVGLDAAQLREYWSGMEIGDTIKVDSEHERSDGTQFPVEVWVTKLDILGEPRYLALARDVTERVEQQREIQALKERLELAVEGAGVGVWDWNMATDAVEFNERWAEMLGYSLAEIEPHLDAWERRVHPADLPVVEAALEAHRAGETDYYEAEHRMQTADGDWKWIYDIGKIVARDADGEPKRAVGLHVDADDRKKRERTLERRQALLETTSDVVFLLDEDGVVQYQNHCKEHLPGPDAVDLVGREPASIMHPEDTEQAEATFEAVLEEPGATASNELRLRAANGEWRWYENRVVNLLEDPAVDGVLVSSRDITERKRQELFLEKAQEIGDIGWWRKDIPSDQIYWSDRICELWAADIEGGFIDHDQFLEFIHPDDATRVDQAWQAALEGDAYDVEHRIVTGDGETRWMREIAEFDRDADGEPVSAVGLVQDITERKRREQRLQQFRRAVDQAASAIYITDVDGTIEYVNPAFEELTGYSTDETLGELPELLQSGEHDDPYYREFWETILSGQQWESEVVDQRADGEEITLYQTVSPITDDDGKPTKFVAIARDISEQKRYEAQLETQRDNLDILNQVVRHDIRNDLQLIQAYTDMVLEAEAVDGPHEEYLSTVRRATSNAIGLTTTARDLADVMLQTDADLKPVPLEDVLQRQVDRLRATHETAVISVSGVPTQVTVMADDLLDAVVRNLLKNAIQHNDKDVPEITVASAVEDERVTVRIADNGPGISEKHKAEIFGRGKQGLDSEGTGIGLYLVETLVSRYGGSVSVVDNNPEGAVFIVELHRSH